MSRTRVATILWCAVACTSAFIPSAAATSRGVLITPADIPTKARTKLQSQIQKARKTHTDAFVRIGQLRAKLPDLAARSRGRLPVITPLLKSLGAPALMPMLERMAVDAPTRGKLSKKAWLGWRTSLIEAVGMLRDKRTEPVLRAILDSPQTEFLVIKLAATAYGKLGTDAVANKLVALSKKADRKQLGVLAGMGYCRRLVVAKRLAVALDARPNAKTAKAIARSLGDVGNSWVWKHPTATHKDEEDAVRTTAAETLVEAFVDYGSGVRRMMTKAILVVDHDDTLDMIKKARRRASPEARVALDKLRKRVINSPFRR